MPVPFEILLVEDYESDVKLLLLLLRRHRIMNKVHVIDNGAEALDFLFCRGKHANRISEPLPGVILLDVRIPKVDGLEALQEIKRNPTTRNVPVIMLSGTLSPEQVDKCNSLGASACLEKPVRIEDLCNLSRTVGFSWLLMKPEFTEQR
jgi:two-component system, response regulator